MMPRFELRGAYISHSIEHELHILRICCTGVMTVDLLLRGLVLGDKLRLDVLRRRLVFIRARIIMKADGQR